MEDHMKLRPFIIILAIVLAFGLPFISIPDVESAIMGMGLSGIICRDGTESETGWDCPIGVT